MIRDPLLASRGRRRALSSRNLPFVTASFLGLAIGCSPAEPPSPEPADDRCHASISCETGDLLAGCGECLAASAAFSLQGCSAELSTDTIEATLGVGVDFVTSLHTLADGARLSEQIRDDFLRVLYVLAFDPTSDAQQAPFSFDGNGVYAAELASFGSSTWAGRFRFGADYEAGATGDLIVPSVFIAGSYVQNPSVVVSGASAEVSFTGPGPLVELLGQGPSPESPVTIEVFDASQETQRQVLEERLFINEPGARGAAISFETKRTLGPYGVPDSEAVPEPLELVASKPIQTTLGQTATIAHWDVVSGAGTIELLVEGGAYSYVAVVTLTPNDPLSVEFRCAE